MRRGPRPPIPKLVRIHHCGGVTALACNPQEDFLKRALCVQVGGVSLHAVADAATAAQPRTCRSPQSSMSSSGGAPSMSRNRREIARSDFSTCVPAHRSLHVLKHDHIHKQTN